MQLNFHVQKKTFYYKLSTLSVEYGRLSSISFLLALNSDRLEVLRVHWTNFIKALK